LEIRRVAWSFLVEEQAELARPRKGQDQSSLRKAMATFYAVVEAPGDDRSSRDGQKACSKAWAELAREVRRNKELSDPLASAQGYLGAECGGAYARKALPLLTRFTKRYKQADLVYYSGRFWLAEVYLELNQTSKAQTEYRYVLGELESPLYPLAQLRTAHCYWDAGEAEQARTNLQYVLDWIGTRTSPPWVRSLKRQVNEDLAGFSE
jgi:hypothetical protein